MNWEPRLAFVGGEGGSARLLNWSSGTAAAAEVPGHEGHVGGVLSDNGLWLATNDSTAVRLFDLRSLECRLSIPYRKLKLFGGQNLWFTRDGRWFILAREGQLFLVSLRSGNDPLAPMELRGHNYQRIIFRLSSDEHWLVSADLWMEPPKGFQPVSCCLIWDLWSPSPADSAVSLPGLAQGVDRLAITKDDQWLITASPDGVRIWPLGTQHLLRLARRTISRDWTGEEPERSGVVPRRGNSTQRPFGGNAGGSLWDDASL